MMYYFLFVGLCCPSDALINNNDDDDDAVLGKKFDRWTLGISNCAPVDPLS
jgi:hypothetical protein